MDLRLAAMIANAHLRLRQTVIDLYPHLLDEGLGMDTKKQPLSIPRPVELFGMRARLLRAQAQKRDITATGKAYDEVMDGIDDAHSAIKGHVSDLRTVEYSLRSTIESMIDRTNGAPSDGESDGRQLPSDQSEQGGKAEVKAEDAKAQTAIEPEAVAPETASEPEPLTVNGVSVAP